MNRHHHWDSSWIDDSGGARVRYRLAWSMQKSDYRLELWASDPKKPAYPESTNGRWVEASEYLTREAEAAVLRRRLAIAFGGAVQEFIGAAAAAAVQLGVGFGFRIEPLRNEIAPAAQPFARPKALAIQVLCGHFESSTEVNALALREGEFDGETDATQYARALVQRLADSLLDDKGDEA